ncbi:MAG: DUF2807 domain-containing protein [Croceitalea sp.]|nr:DUF2807 domain-containing protein [Croceitalea sp.]
MKTTKLICLLLLTLQIGRAQDQKITLDLEPFLQVKAFDGISINLIKSDENKAVITGVNTQKVVLVNNEGELKVRMEIDKIFSGYRTFVDLYHDGELTIIDVNEDAKIASKDTYMQDVLDLRAQEGGELDIKCQTEQLLIKAVTGGKVFTAGFTDNQDIVINTGGVYNGKTLKSKFTTISVNAGGTAELYATKYVKADVKAGGTVKVYGDPEKMDQKTVFGGKIERVE